MPFLEVERSPKGLEVQQMAEAVREEMLEVASGAIGEIIGLHWKMEQLCSNRAPEIVAQIKKTCPEIDDRCSKNYALLVAAAEEVFGSQS